MNTYVKLHTFMFSGYLLNDVEIIGLETTSSLYHMCDDYTTWCGCVVVVQLVCGKELSQIPS